MGRPANQRRDHVQGPSRGAVRRARPGRRRRRRHPVVRRADQRGRARPATIPTGRRPRCARCCARSTPHRIQSDITKLVGFGTRHTLSSQTDPNRGIGAARDWIFDQLQSYAAASGGRMTVQKQSFVQPPAPRNPDPDDGHQPRRHAARARRPSRPTASTWSAATTTRACTDVLNFTCDAPGRRRRRLGRGRRARAGAGHGQAPVRRARSSSWPWPARSRASTARPSSPSRPRRPGMDVEGMFTNDIVGSSTSDNGPARPVHRAPVLRGRADHRDAAAGRPAPVDRRRERRALAPARAATSRRSARTRPPACTCG